MIGLIIVIARSNTKIPLVYVIKFRAMDNSGIRNVSSRSKKGVFDRLKSGEPIRLNDSEYSKVQEVVDRTLRLSTQLNSSTDTGQIRKRLSEITGSETDVTTTIFMPFYTNFGRFIQIGKNAFINHACSFLDMGGIFIEDNVLIGPKFSLITENHPLNPVNRRALVSKPIVIKCNAWIGAAATILPGVTVGENSVIAAGAVVITDVPADTVAGGVPGKFIKKI
jgi:acetyltransferase-like isoleucine patch superfamily enzyme